MNLKTDRAVRKSASSDLTGTSILYHYLEKELQQRDVFMFQMLAARLVTDLGVWLHPEVYERLPIMLPFAVRDESARGRRNGKEMWSSPTDTGLLRDDNSLIKEIVKYAPITAPAHRKLYDGKKIGKASGWVAAHVWQLRADGTRASRHRDTNSFVPNIVWLPKDVARLTDRPGSFVQLFTQALSASIYRNRRMNDPRSVFSQRAWDQLEVPNQKEIPTQALPSMDQLNFFKPGERWVNDRILLLSRVVTGLDAAARGEPVASARPRRYFEGLTALNPVNTVELRRDLTSYLGAVDVSQPSDT